MSVVASTDWVGVAVVVVVAPGLCVWRTAAGTFFRPRQMTTTNYRLRTTPDKVSRQRALRLVGQ
jgi:hypothetical protein